MHFAFEWLCVFRPMIPAIEVRCSSSVCLACWREPDHAAKAVNKTQSKKDPKSMSIWSDNIWYFFGKQNVLEWFRTDTRICNEFPLVFESRVRLFDDQWCQCRIALPHQPAKTATSYLILEPGPRYTSNSHEKQKLAQDELEKEAVPDQSGTLAKWGVIWAQGCDMSLHNVKSNFIRL